MQKREERQWKQLYEIFLLKKRGERLTRNQHYIWERNYSEFRKGHGATVDRSRFEGLVKNYAQFVRARNASESSRKRMLGVLAFGLRAFVDVFARMFQGTKATPRNCELILSLLLTKTEQEPAIGDFLERYHQKCRRIGRRRADVWAYSDVIRTVWPY